MITERGGRFLKKSNAGSNSSNDAANNNSKGEEVPLIEESIMPSAFNGDPQVFYAVTLMVLGFLTIFILERLGTKTNN